MTPHSSSDKSNRMIKLLSKELESHLHSVNQQLKLGSDPNKFPRAELVLENRTGC